MRLFKCPECETIYAGKDIDTGGRCMVPNCKGILTEIRVGRLGIVGKRDILLVKELDWGEGSYQLMHDLHKCLPLNLVILIPKGSSLQTVSEKEMNQAGWFKK
jgi:hypothetical protein